MFCFLVHINYCSDSVLKYAVKTQEGMNTGEEEGHITTTLSDSREAGVYEGFCMLALDPTTILLSGQNSHCIYYDSLVLFSKMNT